MTQVELTPTETACAESLVAADRMIGEHVLGPHRRRMMLFLKSVAVAHGLPMEQLELRPDGGVVVSPSPSKPVPPDQPPPITTPQSELVSTNGHAEVPKGFLKKHRRR